LADPIDESARSNTSPPKHDDNYSIDPVPQPKSKLTGLRKQQTEKKSEFSRPRSRIAEPDPEPIDAWDFRDSEKKQAAPMILTSKKNIFSSSTRPQSGHEIICPTFQRIYPYKRANSKLEFPKDDHSIANSDEEHFQNDTPIVSSRIFPSSKNPTSPESLPKLSLQHQATKPLPRGIKTQFSSFLNSTRNIVGHSYQTDTQAPTDTNSDF
jgi:hypothetical protein